MKSVGMCLRIYGGKVLAGVDVQNPRPTERKSEK